MTMKITRLETIWLDDQPNTTWVRIHTDDGLMGLGETFYVPRAISAMVHDVFANLLLGRSAFDIESHWQNMFYTVNFFGYGGSETRAISAVDVALWDLLGQYTGQPIYNLLGAPDRISADKFEFEHNYNQTTRNAVYAFMGRWLVGINDLDSTREGVVTPETPETLLTFSKDREPELMASDLNETVSDVVELMQTRAAEAAAQLAWQPRGALPMFTFDPELMHRAILNVVTNAIDACEKQDGAKVEVSIEYALGDRTVRIVVADNGEGIAPEDIKKIFSIFESRKGSRGTGLGLPVSQKILREHGGDIHVESTLGVGSKFILELPALVAEDSKVRKTMAS